MGDKTKGKNDLSVCIKRISFDDDLPGTFVVEIGSNECFGTIFV
jgi:hypothetical protein